ncbi:MAG: D-alanyl-D-alanine carboxypeptidase family protein [Ferrimicrobium sp.]
MARGNLWVTPSGRARRSSGPKIFLRRLGVAVVVVVLLVGVVSVVQLLRGIPAPTYAQSMPTSYPIPGAKPALAWPTQGEAAAEILGVGSLGQHGGTAPEQIASVAKMTTALLIMKDHPLSLGQSGPKLTITPGDYQTYLGDKNASDSVLPVAPGEVLSEYQLLEGLLIPSGDNIATLLAQWDAGSTSSFVAKMDAFVTQLGLHHTHYGDPSGLTGSTVSIPRDQLKIADSFEANPVLAQIASQAQATLPVAGTVYNVNYALGRNNINGIKTGSILTGNFVMSTQIKVGTKTLTGIGAILGQGGAQPLITALDAGKAMAASMQSIPRSVTVLRAHQVVGSISVPGSAGVSVEVGSGVSAVGWGGLGVTASATVDSHLYGAKAGQKIGTLSVTVGQQLSIVPLVIVQSVKTPSTLWRLTHF